MFNKKANDDSALFVMPVRAVDNRPRATVAVKKLDKMDSFSPTPKKETEPAKTGFEPVKAV